MQAVPHRYAELIAAVNCDNTAHLRAWLDQFSALAESLEMYHTGPAHALASWATDQIDEQLAL